MGRTEDIAALSFIVEMAHGRPGDPDFATFSCGDVAWKGLLSTAQTFGWVPLGAIPDPQAARGNEAYTRLFVPTYDPNEWAYCKQISGADAAALAVALRAAVKSIQEGNVRIFERPGSTVLRDGMTEAEYRQVNQLPSALLERFARFAEGGGFAFAWDD